MGSYKTVTTKLTVEDAVSSALSVLEELADEMRSWADSMSGTNLENTEKSEAVEEAADALEAAHEEVEVPEEYASQEVEVAEQVLRYKRRHGPSRAVRRDNALIALQAVLMLVDKAASDRLSDDATDFVGTLENVTAWAEDVEFPSMFG